MINDVLREMLDNGLVVYLDDILLYAETLEELDRLTQQCLAKLDAAGLALNRKKCEWQVTKVEFLGFVISSEGISMSTDKIDTIQK